jgi:hypothetical protein
MEQPENSQASSSAEELIEFFQSALKHLGFAEVDPKRHIGQRRFLALDFQEPGFNGILDDEPDRRHWFCLPESVL